MPPSRIRAAVVGIAGNYGLAVLTMAEGLIVIPLCLARIDPSLYGAWLASGDVLAWLAVFDMGLGSTMVLRIAGAHARGDKPQLAQDLFAGMIALFAMVVLLVSTGLLISGYVPIFLGLSGLSADQLSLCFKLATVSAGLSILNNGFAGFASGVQQVTPVLVSGYVGALSSLSLTVWLLFHGYGLLAIPLSLVARSALVCTINLSNVVRMYRKMGLCLDPAIGGTLKWYFRTSTTVSLSKVAGILLARCDSIVIAKLVGPEAVAMFVLNRRAVDFLRTVMDRFSSAFYAPFAHLFGSGDRQRSREIARGVMSASFGVCLVGAAVYEAFNGSFLRLWLNTPNYVNNNLTGLLALAAIATSINYLLLYLYSGTGELQRSSLIAFVEVPMRLPLLGVLVYFGSIYGAPAASIITTSILNVVLVRAVAAKLGSRPTDGLTLPKLFVYGLIALSSLVMSHFLHLTSWSVFIPAATLYGAVCGAALWAVDRDSRDLLGSAWKGIRRRQVPQ